MLRNNADARRCSYFEFGLPVLGDGGRVGLENCADPGFFSAGDGREALGVQFMHSSFHAVTRWFLLWAPDLIDDMRSTRGKIS